MGFCPRCGKKTEHQFCEACLRELHPLITNVKPVQLILCPNCSRTYTKNAWTTKPLQDALERQLDKNIEYSLNSRIDEVVVEQASIEPGKQMIQVTVIGSADSEGESYEENYEIIVLIEGRRCTQCEHLANTYFTGIIQLRRPNEEVQAAIERNLGKAMSSVKDVIGGIDYFVTDHRILQNVARKVHEEFGGELTIRAQHFSYDSLKSKNLYRVNACIRLPKFWKGSLIQAGTKLFFITNMGKRLKGIDIKTGKQLSASCKNEYLFFDLQETSVVTTRPSISVLHPETFQTVPIMNERDEWKQANPGDTVTVAIINEQVYMVHL